MTEQNFKNHFKFVPLYHFVALPLLLVNLGWAVWQLVGAQGVPQFLAVAVAAALFLGALFGRVFALKVQDRVIRLEMRLRLVGVLPQEQRGASDRLSTAQLIGLRFASDAELPGLIKTVLDGNIQNKNAIKKMVKHWVPDYERA